MSLILKCWGPLDRMGCVANPPIDGPFLILSPAPKLWGSLRRQGLCSHQDHMWAISEFVPRSEAVGTLEGAWVMYPLGPLGSPVLMLAPFLSVGDPKVV